jgi:hypothetical protein
MNILQCYRCGTTATSPHELTDTPGWFDIDENPEEEAGPTHHGLCPTCAPKPDTPEYQQLQTIITKSHTILTAIHNKTLAVAEFLKWLSTTKQINLHATTNDILRGISKHHPLPIPEIEALHQEFFEPYINHLEQLHAQKIQLLSNLHQKNTTP